MDKKDRLQKEHALAQIRLMRLKQKMTDREICEAVKISRATLYRYKREIYKEDKEILTESLADNMAHEIVNIIDSLHETIENMRKIASSSATPMERIEAEKMKIQCHSDLINLLTKGPFLFANIVQSARLIGKE